MLAIRLSEELENRLTHLAKMTGRSKSFYVRQAIEDRLDDLEDIYLAEQILSEVRLGKEAVFTLESVEHELGLED